MPAEEKKSSYSLEDYGDFLAALAEGGLEVLVIGGCAVGAYGRLRGESILSADLDLYTTIDTQIQIMAWAPAKGGRIVKRPQPRALSVVFLDWNGKEINVLTETRNLPPPAEAFQEAREFRLRSHGGLPVLVVDPYDLLANKLEVDRPKDKPHQEVLRRFLEEEAVEAFRVETAPRDRIAPAQRLLEVLKESRLPVDLAQRILPFARTQTDFRFLFGRAPTKDFEEEVLKGIPESLHLKEELEKMRKRRRE
jgi:hypothetical protein